MKRRRFKWIWLFLGVLLISATCGFGYEAKATRTRFEEAKDAFGKQDWERVVENLSDTTDPGRPNPKAFAAFLHAYLDPELAKGKYKLLNHESNSSLVPIKNEWIGYLENESPRTSIAVLRYVDDAMWFSIPFSPQKVSVFRGKLVNMSFASCFYRICAARRPLEKRRPNWRAILQFVGSEKENLVKIGISPKNLYSSKETWDEYMAEYQKAFDKLSKTSPNAFPNR
jgi:hypothetical protein